MSIHSSIQPLVAILFSLCMQSPALAQDPPKVVELGPRHMAMDVDAEKTTTLTIKFDQRMNHGGRSICGGGPAMPRIVSIRWKSGDTVEITVKLEPDHSYHMSLNCPSAKNFRSAKGISLAPTPWSFTTLPKVLLPMKEQRKINKKAFKALGDKLASKYSYYDLKKINWRKLFKTHEKSILSSRTNTIWARNVAEMLKVTNDLHLSLRASEQVFGAGSRRIDPLFRNKVLPQYFAKLKRGPKGTLVGTTKDGIGYLMISSWTDRVDIAAVEKHLEALCADRSIKALVLDVRVNSGGGELLARRVARFFVKGSPVYAKNVTRVAKGKKGMTPVLSRRIQGNEAKQRFRRPVAILISRYCMSSNEAFVLMMKQAEKSTLVGQQTYGSSGNPKRHDLPNGVIAVLPSWKALRLDGTCFEGEGIAPDVEVVPSEKELESKDPILVKALSLLRK